MTSTQPTSEFFVTPYYDEAGHVTCRMVVVVGDSLSLSSATPKCINERVDICHSTCILLYAADTVSLIP